MSMAFKPVAGLPVEFITSPETAELPDAGVDLAAAETTFIRANTITRRFLTTGNEPDITAVREQTAATLTELQGSTDEASIALLAARTRIVAAAAELSMPDGKLHHAVTHVIGGALLARTAPTAVESRRNPADPAHFRMLGAVVASRLFWGKKIRDWRLTQITAVTNYHAPGTGKAL